MGFFKTITLFSLILALGCNAEEMIGDAFASASFQNLRAVEANAGGLCLSEHNAARSQNGKGALAYDSKLEQAAKNHNNVMTSQNCFSHQCKNEPSVGQRVTNAGYRWSGVAENISAGRDNCKSAVEGWMNSDGHRKNILGNYKHIGCAFSKCSNCDYPYYWTCVFGNPM